MCTSFLLILLQAHYLYQMIERVPTIDTGIVAKEKLSVQGTIEFQNVTFAYSGSDGTERPVFKNLSLKIKAGQTVAFVGESGSGKSTIGKLVSRFYDPKIGNVLIDGKNIRDFNVNALRENIGVVSQEPLLFDTSVRQNIAYGLKDYEKVTDKQVVAAAKAANAHDFIMSNQFPNHYQERVGSRGGKLSGGQKQRIAIARAVLRNPPILILDEATSALDTVSEQIVQDALDVLLQGEQKRTTIVIAHRLSTVRKADRIIVLGEGQEGMGGGTAIVESGTHDELMSTKGVYYGLVGAQGEGGTGGGNSEAVDDDEPDMSIKESDAQRSSSYKSENAEDANIISDGKKADKDDDDKKDTEDLYKVPSNRLWKYAKGKTCSIYFGCLSAGLNGCVFPSMGFFLGEMLDAFTEWEDAKARSNFLVLFFIFMGLGFAAFVTRTGQIGFFTVSGEQITKGVRGDLFRAMLRQNIEWFDASDNSVGALMTMLGMDAATVQNITGQSLGSIINSGVCALLGLSIGFSVSWRLSLALLGAVPLLGAAEGVQQTLLTQGEKNVGDALNESAQIVNESVLSAKEIQAFGLQNVVHKFYTDLLKIPTKARKKSAFATGMSMGLVQFVTFSFYAGAFYYGGWLVENKYIKFDGFMKALFVMAFMASGAGQAATYAGNVTKSKLSTSKIFRLIDRIPPIDSKPWNAEGEKRVPLPENTIPAAEFLGNVTLEGIHFAYPTRKEADVFTGMSLQIEAGQTVALIGTSGSGKSTVIQLVERFYDPIRRTKDGSQQKAIDIVELKEGKSQKEGPSTHGRILLDGRDLKDLDLKWLRSNIGLVGQEPRLFQGSIAENIAMGKTTGAPATREEIESAAKSSNAHNFIMKMVNGYDTDVGPGGSKLSGGQKQRVAIARAIIKNPKILLLDEATSALDNGEL